MSWLVQVELPWACFGLEVDDHGQVVTAAPIAAWTLGRPARPVLAGYRRRGGQLTWTRLPDPPKEVTP